MEQSVGHHDETARAVALLGAERMALKLLDAIEAAGFIKAGRTAHEIEMDIRNLAKETFGIERDWHKRIVRAGVNTLSVAADNPPIRTMEDDDIVFLDRGPVFEEWEADVGRSYAVGDDPQKHALCREPPRQFKKVRRHFEANPGVTGADLYAFACASAEQAGWKFGGKIAGHIVAEFPHARIPGVKQLHHASPENPEPMRDLDANGRVRRWILAIHLVSPDEKFGGFHERLLAGDAAETAAA